MAGLPETSDWENEIYQIERTDPVEGGPPDLAQGRGIANAPHAQLASRTAWLKAQLAILSAEIDALENAGFATPADITAAINNLIDGAPGALDTLKELADELNDQDSAVAALTAALAGKLGVTEKAANSDKFGGLSIGSFLRSDASSRAHEYVIFEKGIFVGEDGLSDSLTHYWDDTAKTWRTLRWDNSEGEFRIEDSAGIHRRIWHSGNLQDAVFYDLPMGSTTDTNWDGIQFDESTNTFIFAADTSKDSPNPIGSILDVGKLRVNSVADASSSSTDHGFEIGVPGNNVRIDTNEINFAGNGYIMSHDNTVVSISSTGLNLGHDLTGALTWKGKGITHADLDHGDEAMPVLAIVHDGTDVAPGDTISGLKLRPASIISVLPSISIGSSSYRSLGDGACLAFKDTPLSGTYRCIGAAEANSTWKSATLFIKVDD